MKKLLALLAFALASCTSTTSQTATIETTTDGLSTATATAEAPQVADPAADTPQVYTTSVLDPTTGQMQVKMYMATNGVLLPLN